MFQPMPTPFASQCFNSYGLPGGDFPSFSSAPLQSAPSSHNASGSSNGPRGHHHQPHPGPGPAGAVNGRNATHPQHSHQQFYSSPSHASTPSTASPVVSQGHFLPTLGLQSSYPRQVSPQSAPSPAAKMEQSDAQIAQALQDELAAQEAAARDYQPQLEGPLVGERVSSSTITNEYAKADPIYVQKTSTLPQMYDQFRPIQGDGNCGWRAIGFSYFEALAKGGDENQVTAELNRLDTLESLLENAGFPKLLFDDMVQETLDLLRSIRGCLSDTVAAMSLVMGRWNDRNRSNAMIYHLRILASAWFKSNPGPYEAFVSDLGGVQGYCSNIIEKVDQEIDQVGLMLLADILLKPNNLGLEIAYLDRSPGTQLDVYRMLEHDPSLGRGSIVYLLYRPDHYDILYKADVQVHRVAFAPHHSIQEPTPLGGGGYGDSDFTALSMVPGLLTPTASGLSALSPAQPSSPTGINETFMAVAPQPGPWMAGPTPNAAPSQYAGVIAPQGHPHPPSPLATTLPPADASLTPSPATNYPLRFSPQFYKLEQTSHPEPSFRTAMFKNSHYNKAHYNNPHFSPEQWTPEDDQPEKPHGHKKKGRGSKHE